MTSSRGDETAGGDPDVRSALYAWDDESTYIQNPPFFVGSREEVAPITPILAARVPVACSATR